MGIVLGIATLLGGIAALWFFWDKIAAFFKSKPEISVSPTENSILHLIENSNPRDWEYYDPQAKYFYKRDVQLHINRHPVDVGKQFSEAWAHKFPDRSAQAVKFTISYGTTQIKDVWAVNVDGGRCYIPFPKSADILTISQWQYALGKVINVGSSYDYDDYLQRSGIKVYSP